MRILVNAVFHQFQVFVLCVVLGLLILSVIKFIRARVEGRFEDEIFRRLLLAVVILSCVNMLVALWSTLQSFESSASMTTFTFYAHLFDYMWSTSQFWKHAAHLFVVLTSVIWVNRLTENTKKWQGLTAYGLLCGIGLVGIHLKRLSVSLHIF